MEESESTQEFAYVHTEDFAVAGDIYEAYLWLKNKFEEQK